MNEFYVNVDVLVQDSMVLIAHGGGVDVIPRYAHQDVDFLIVGNVIVAAMAAICLILISVLLLKQVMK